MRLTGLIDGRSLIKTKLNCLINNVCFRVQSITKKAKHRNYIVKVHSEKYSTYVKYSICLLKPKKTDLRDGARPDSHVTAV